MYQVDAFAERAFEGNPAAVLILEDWPSDDVMQAIANENNLAETAFARLNGEGWDLRWFTPVHEVDFCGHATLATAHVLAAEHNVLGDMAFATRVGELRVCQREGAYQLDLPCFPPQPLGGKLMQALQEIFPLGSVSSFRNFESSLPTRHPYGHSFPICSGSEPFILLAWSLLPLGEPMISSRVISCPERAFPRIR